MKLPYSYLSIGMSAPFSYHSHSLYAEKVEIASILQEIETPFYLYSSASMTKAYELLATHVGKLDPLICYAMKANSNQTVLRHFARLGAGVDVVSGGELYRAVQAGIPGSKITFSGVGKSDEEIRAALHARILCFNVESAPELARISHIAQAMGQLAPISMRLNPDIDARTHHKISTGKAENKFGIPLEEARALYAQAAHMPGVQVMGVDMHIGSQILDLAPMAHAFARLAEMVRQLREDGHDISHIDVGGGLGIPYQEGDPQPEDLVNAYSALLKTHIAPLGGKIILEPGRFLVGNAGILVTKILYVKEGEGKTFVIVDAAMNDLIRPTLYEAHHAIKPIKNPHRPQEAIVDVVGPVCETGDYLAKDRRLPWVRDGEYLAFFSTGAYGAVQSGTYNSRLLIPEIWVRGAQFFVIRPRKTYQDLVDLDKIPPWLGEGM